MMQDERNEREWRDSASWRGGWLGVYHGRRDTRVRVPKRRRAMGWTVNTARPAGMAWTIFFAGLLVAAVAVAAPGY